MSLRVPFRGSFLYAAFCNARQSGNFRTYMWFISHAFLENKFCHCNVAHRLALICHDSRHHPELWDVYLILSNMINILKIVWLSLNLLGLPVIIIIKGKTNPGWSPKKRLDSYMPCRAMALTLKYWTQLIRLKQACISTRCKLKHCLEERDLLRAITDKILG